MVVDYVSTGVYAFVQTKSEGYTEGQQKVFFAVRAGTYANGEHIIEKWIPVDRPTPPSPKPAPKPADTFTPGSMNDPVH